MNNNIMVKYSSPAAPKNNILLHKTYTVGELLNNLKLDLDYIKMAFSPIDKSWEDYDKPKRKAKIEEDNTITTEVE